MNARLAAALSVLALAASWSAAPAQANLSNCSADQPPAPSQRIVRGELDGLTFNVLLPSDYAQSVRRYRVLYLLHGLDFNENTWLDQTDVAQFTAPFTGDRAAIVVSPDGGPNASYVDWQDGTEDWETYHVDRMIPYVDAHFRTIPDRAHRAIAGFSAGGYGASDYAARHPDLFSALGSFSGVDDNGYSLTPPYQTPNGQQGQHSSPVPTGSPTSAPYAPPTDNGSGCEGGTPLGPNGDPVTNDVSFRSHNPPDLAFNLRGVSVYIANGDGVPCGPQDVQQELQFPNFGAPGEAAIKLTGESFANALTQAGIAHTDDFYGCGLHTMLYAQRDLHAFWPLMLAGLGKHAPDTFDYRTADPQFSVWGWSFQADPRRAPEFLDITGANANGLTLVGSGREHVTTAPDFNPRQIVDLRGATTATATADQNGRLSFTADLGPPHTTKQFTPGAPSGTFGKATVMFSLPVDTLNSAIGRRPARACRADSVITLRLHAPRAVRITRASAIIGRRLVDTERGRSLTQLRFRRSSQRTFTLRLVTHLSNGATIETIRRYPACATTSPTSRHPRVRRPITRGALNSTAA